MTDPNVGLLGPHALHKIPGVGASGGGTSNFTFAYPVPEDDFTTGSEANTDGTITVTLPSGLADNDLICIVVGSANSHLHITATGYTEVVTAGVSADQRVEMLAKIASSEGSTQDVSVPSGNEITWVCYRIDGANFWDGNGAALDVATPHNHDNFSDDWGGSAVITYYSGAGLGYLPVTHFAVMATGPNNSATISGVPSGYTELAILSVDGGNGQLAVGYKQELMETDSSQNMTVTPGVFSGTGTPNDASFLVWGHVGVLTDAS